MSDFSSMSRESKKDKLRRQVVRPQQAAWNADPQEDSEAVVRKAADGDWCSCLCFSLREGQPRGSFTSAITTIPAMKQRGRWI